MASKIVIAAITNDPNECVYMCFVLNVLSLGSLDPPGLSLCIEDDVPFVGDIFDDSTPPPKPESVHVRKVSETNIPIVSEADIPIAPEIDTHITQPRMPFLANPVLSQHLLRFRPFRNRQKGQGESLPPPTYDHPIGPQEIKGWTKLAFGANKKRKVHDLEPMDEDSF